MSDELSFRREARRPGKGLSGFLLLGMVVVVLLAASRPLWSPDVSEGAVVEVRGEVPRPGLHTVRVLSVHEAVRAAGGSPEGLDDAPLSPGDRVVVEGGQARVAPPSNPLLIALPIDVNEASAEALQAIPGIGSWTAEAIVTEREARGPYRSLQDLTRARGVGEQTLELLAPFVTLSEPPPTDLNTASAAELELLPGIGPVLAARIVVERADGGPFASIDDLRRVEGVGEATIEGLRGLAEARP